MLRTCLIAFAASFIFFFAALSWTPEAATFLVVRTFVTEFAKSNSPMLLLIGAAAAACLVWIAYNDWSRREVERQKTTPYS
jgi:hypothetical protein